MRPIVALSSLLLLLPTFLPTEAQAGKGKSTAPAAPAKAEGKPTDRPATRSGTSLAGAADCIECHGKRTPRLVEDWRLSRHASQKIGCDVCHGSGHHSKDDVDKVSLPTASTCGACHQERFAQFKAGKHALAWAAMKAMPTFHYQPLAMTQGEKGCGGCHKLGFKSQDEIRELNQRGVRFGNASCDACHTRHSFSLAEARSPQACQTCHMGFDHAQWEMWSGSKHGVRHGLKQLGTLGPEASAPSCQTCHMKDGDHAVKTAWGFLGVRLPLPEDPKWAADRTLLLQALGALDLSGSSTERFEVLKALDLVRTSQEEWQERRDQMIQTCNQCHSANFARQQLAESDDLIRAADGLMAEAIRVVAALYKDHLVPLPKENERVFPDLLQFHDAASVPEQKLFVMFMEHRMRTFQGSFHANPDYVTWYGWSEMVRDLAEIKAAAEELRFRAAAGAAKQ